MTADAWQIARTANERAVVSHPDFPKLVREVAAWDGWQQTTPYRLRMNSPTYGSWWARLPDGMGGDGVRMNYRHRKYNKRVKPIAERIAHDVMPEYFPESEAVAFAFGMAWDYVKARRLP